jgi:hypothetical protein
MFILPSSFIPSFLHSFIPLEWNTYGTLTMCSNIALHSKQRTDAFDAAGVALTDPMTNVNANANPNSNLNLVKFIVWGGGSDWITTIPPSHQIRHISRVSWLLIKMRLCIESMMVCNQVAGSQSSRGSSQ